MDIVKLLKAVVEFLTVLLQGGFTRISKKIRTIYERLGETVDDPALAIQRALILRVHNGGGNLSSSRPTYVSVLYEETRKPLAPVHQKLQNIPADKQLMSLCQELRINKSVVVDPLTLPEDSYLRNFYLSQGVKQSHIFFIKETKGGFLWRETKEMHLLGISTMEDNVNFDAPVAKEAFVRLIADIKRNL